MNSPSRLHCTVRRPISPASSTKIVQSSSGIVLVRAYGADVEAKASLVADVLETHAAELTMDPPHVVVLQWGRPPRSRSLRDLGTGG